MTGGKGLQELQADTSKDPEHFIEPGPATASPQVVPLHYVFVQNIFKSQDSIL